MAQGFWMAKPMPAAQMPAWTTSWNEEQAVRHLP
jgi:EAL domain-containing protein (putative c-di-GMP-specific phosphodiesterase class I)